MLAGPAAPVEGNPAAAQVSLSGLQPGTYQFQLTVFNPMGLQSQSQVTLTVQAPPAGATPVPPPQTTVDNSGTTVITTAPISGIGPGPFGGPGGGGGGDDGSGGASLQGTAGPTTPGWQQYLAANWWWMALIAAGAIGIAIYENRTKK